MRLSSTYVALTVLSLGVLCRAQSVTDGSPRFEVASIKRSASTEAGSRVAVQPGPRMPLRDLKGLPQPSPAEIFPRRAAPLQYHDQ